jgi:hypothetical protein
MCKDAREILVRCTRESCSVAPDHLNAHDTMSKQVVRRMHRLIALQQLSHSFALLSLSDSASFLRGRCALSSMPMPCCMVISIADVKCSEPAVKWSELNRSEGLVWPSDLFTNGTLHEFALSPPITAQPPFTVEAFCIEEAEQWLHTWFRMQPAFPPATALCPSAQAPASETGS